VQKHLETLISVKFQGQAIPVSLFSTNIHFTTISGNTHVGEHVLDHLSHSKDSVTNVWLEPPALATPKAQKAIREATHIIYCPGSLYGSIIANFLPEGIKQALKNSNASKILITNLTSTRNQTHRFTPQKYLKIFQKYTKLERPFDIIISPHLSTKQFNQKYPKIKTLYQNTHSHFLGWDKKHLKPIQSKAIKVITSNIYSITPQLGRLRHDPKKLAKVLQEALPFEQS
ncbi:YvcK family protein, partial [Patescibacteria group bacterium]|nr:YvcK family protein [Patescibacteria group bacterium]